jgi:hypothetical protein
MKLLVPVLSAIGKVLRLERTTEARLSSPRTRHAGNGESKVYFSDVISALLAAQEKLGAVTCRYQ